MPMSQSELNDDVVAAILLGSHDPAPLVRWWWEAERSYRLGQLAGFVDDVSVEPGLSHPAVGLLAREVDSAGRGRQSDCIPPIPRWLRRDKCSKETRVLDMCGERPLRSGAPASFAGSSGTTVRRTGSRDH